MCDSVGFIPLATERETLIWGGWLCPVTLLDPIRLWYDDEVFESRARQADINYVGLVQRPSL